MNKDDFKMFMGAAAVITLVTIIVVSSYIANHATGTEKMIAQGIESEAEELLAKEITETH